MWYVMRSVEESYADFKKYDVGDILGIKGKVFKTQTGEISIRDAREVLTFIQEFADFTRENTTGLTDTDARISSEIRGPYHERGCKRYGPKRSKVISSIRRT